MALSITSNLLLASSSNPDSLSQNSQLASSRKEKISPPLLTSKLTLGRFLSSLNTQSPALNVVSRSNLHGLVACGGEDGAVECFDMRTRSSVGRINAVAAAGMLTR
ncbi:hypothetical protein CK203_027178 [Vitis vinifera]|uniref:Uncharacterized protein n=1 Tax=Vitis vinifera TaxID=29760 RepID=A0A438I645_VITVI|nr:hypothetical protein CK203_027178 [Vitis vinifera]